MGAEAYGLFGGAPCTPSRFRRRTRPTPSWQLRFKAATRELITFSEHFALGAAADFGIIELRWSAGQYSGARLSAEPGRGARAKALRPWAATAQHADSQ